MAEKGYIGKIKNTGTQIVKGPYSGGNKKGKSTVKKGDLIAEYVPAKPGLPGTNVFGYDRQPKAVKDLPKLPGLGVEVNKELVIEENKTPHNWKNPVWRHADGSVAEW